MNKNGLPVRRSDPPFDKSYDARTEYALNNYRWTKEDLMIGFTPGTTVALQRRRQPEITQYGKDVEKMMNEGATDGNLRYKRFRKDQAVETEDGRRVGIVSAVKDGLVYVNMYEIDYNATSNNDTITTGSHMTVYFEDGRPLPDNNNLEDLGVSFLTIIKDQLRNEDAREDQVTAKAVRKFIDRTEKLDPIVGTFDAEPNPYMFGGAPPADDTDPMDV